MPPDEDPLVLGFVTADPLAFVANESGPARLRAPRRSDTVKRQVSVPADIWNRLEAAAGPLGTTPNDLFLRLASTGLTRVEQLGRTRAVAEARWAAFEQADAAHAAADAPALTADELVRAAQAYGDDE